MKFLILVTVILIGTAVGFSQTQTTSGVTPEMRVEANRLYQASDWPNAIATYEKIVAIEPENPNANFRLGNAYLNLTRNTEAQKPLEKAFTISPNPINGLALARASARNRNKAKVFDTLEKTVATGGIAPETLLAEKDFAEWKYDPAFKELVRKNDLAVNPCKASPEFRQFDFWIGEWDVRNPQGVPAGSSIIQLILGQCIILENWSSSSGSNGKSFNIFYTTDRKWHQSWVDDKGTFTHYVGGIIDGKMVLDADIIVGGKAAIARMTFSKLPNSDVRQHGENSTDKGKTWTTTFDLTYVRKR